MTRPTLIPVDEGDDRGGRGSRCRPLLVVPPVAQFAAGCRCCERQTAAAVRPLSAVAGPLHRPLDKCSQSRTPATSGDARPVLVEAVAALQAGDLLDILSDMKRCPHLVSIQERGCRCLWIASWDDDDAAALGRIGAVSVALEAMREHPYASALQQCAAECLYNLARTNEYNRREIVAGAGVEVLLASMENHGRSSCAVATSACAALASVLEDADEESRRAFWGADGLTTVVAAAYEWPLEPSLVRAAHDVLAALDLDLSSHLPPRPPVFDLE